MSLLIFSIRVVLFGLVRLPKSLHKIIERKIVPRHMVKANSRFIKNRNLSEWFRLIGSEQSRNHTSMQSKCYVGFYSGFGYSET